MNAHALEKLWRNETGMTSTEYAILLAVVSLSAVVAFGEYSTEIQTIVNRTSNELLRISGIGCG